METTTENPYDLPVWEHPDSYAGFSPDGDFYVMSQHRDSDTVTRSNYACVLADLKSSAEALGCPEAVYDWRASHWAVGWIEHMCVRRDAPERLQRELRATIDALADYPVYSDDHWSELEWTECCEAWERMTVRERAEILRDAGCSLFAARRDYMPPDDDGRVYELMTNYVNG